MLNKINKTHFFNIFCFILTATYLFLFFRDITPFWFNPEWTTDDALQQTYPFHQILIPDLFKGDLITEVMLGYLAPVHYWLSYFFTVLTGDPIMMGHWVMLIQISVLSLFLFLLIYKLSAFGPACLGLLWIYHTRTFMQRITGGLPRGWSAPLIVAFLYFLVKKNHKAVLLVLFIGCLLHPPSTLICATTYGLYLFFGVVVQKTRKEFLKPLIVLIILSPVYVFTVFKVVERPEHIGQMITYEKALKDPTADSLLFHT